MSSSAATERDEGNADRSGTPRSANLEALIGGACMAKAPHLIPAGA